MRSADSFPSLKLHDDTSFEFFWAWGNLSMQWGAAQATPHFIASMSFRLVIPGWVALQQSPLALRQPSRSCQNRRLIERGSSVISPSSTRLLQTVKDVPAQNVKDVSALDTVLAGWGEVTRDLSRRSRGSRCDHGDVGGQRGRPPVLVVLLQIKPLS